MQNEAVRVELDEFREKTKVAAVVGAVTDADGLLAIEAIGSRSSQDSTPVTVDDLWHIGSCGKSITALLYGCLVEAGKAEWGVPVSELFADIDSIDPSWSTPTVDDLLRCRAGVRANPNRADMIASHKSTDDVTTQRTAATEKVLAGVAKNPGRFLYSNLGYAIVGAAIDRLAGMAFEDALDTYIFEPLGVTTVGTGPPPLVRGHGPRVRLGMLTIGRGKPVELSAKHADNPPAITPAGRFHLSIPDWAAIQRVFLNDGEPLVSSKTIEHLLTDPGQGEKGRSMAMGWADGAQLGVPYAMQGSNTMWSATALLDKDNGRTALVAANDGRMSVLAGSAYLASELLKATS